MRSRRGVPVDSSNLSRITDSGLRSPTNRSVAGKEGETRPAGVVFAGPRSKPVGASLPPDDDPWALGSASLEFGARCRQRFFGLISSRARRNLDIWYNTPFDAGNWDKRAGPERDCATGEYRRAR
ncbi:hypothetical protein N7510_008647 [Penicillium lagena]|uniref:uncharacterized protein n=1 Tax=Penicillium lagena TaxID=94218 RepID=UPI002541D16E|nr:uncharacterized protein N7510_008647 [Penicillium lagena]KAJ5605866.1 hypothetical protein N7510_008647 [Penicillium lagena]